MITNMNPHRMMSCWRKSKLARAIEGERFDIAAGMEMIAPVLTGISRRADGEEGLLELSLGPHHPSTHGVFRMDVVLDGERVVKLKPVFGYLHRNHEKIAEGASYLASMPYTDRLDYIGSLTNNWAYALEVEKLAGIQVPERAEYIRVITAELTRLQNHASTIGFLRKRWEQAARH